MEFGAGPEALCIWNGKMEGGLKHCFYPPGNAPPLPPVFFLGCFFWIIYIEIYRHYFLRAIGFIMFFFVWHILSPCSNTGKTYLSGLQLWQLTAGVWGFVRPVHFSVRKWMRFWHDVERPKHKAASDPTARRGMKYKLLGWGMIALGKQWKKPFVV